MAAFCRRAPGRGAGTIALVPNARAVDPGGLAAPADVTVALRRRTSLPIRVPTAPGLPAVPRPHGLGPSRELWPVVMPSTDYPAIPYFSSTTRARAALCPARRTATLSSRANSVWQPQLRGPASLRCCRSDQPFPTTTGDLKSAPTATVYPDGDGGRRDPSQRASRRTLLGKVALDVNQRHTRLLRHPPVHPNRPGDPATSLRARVRNLPLFFDRQTRHVHRRRGAGAREEWTSRLGTRRIGLRLEDPGGTLALAPGADLPRHPPATRRVSRRLLEYDQSQGDCASRRSASGAQAPGLPCLYLYSDNCTGRIRAGTEAPGCLDAQLLLTTPYNISSSAGPSGSSTWPALTNGTVYRIFSAGRPRSPGYGTVAKATRRRGPPSSDPLSAALPRP